MISLSESPTLPPRDQFPRVCEEVHVWIAQLEEVPRESAILLSEPERERASRFHFERDRDRFIAAHAALRLILSGYLGVNASEITFERGPNGKPHLNETTLTFNLSHSEDLMLVAITERREVGVDVEKVRDYQEVEMLLDHYFSREEADEVITAPADHRADAFFRLWTRTEACLKAAGVGLTEDLCVPNPERWSIESFIPAAGYFAAVAVEGPFQQSPTYYRWPR